MSYFQTIFQTKSNYNFLSNVVNKQTDGYTDRETNSTKNNRSARKAQTSLAKADHYSHLLTFSQGGNECWALVVIERITSKVLDHYLHHDLIMLQLMWCFFGHLLILGDLEHHQNFINSSVYHPGPLLKISSKSVNNILSNVHKQTDKQKFLLVN